MKKKIAILGSTGSIGKTLLKIINKDRNNFQVFLLTANKDYRTLLKQSIKFKVKNLILKHVDNRPFKITASNSVYFSKDLRPQEIHRWDRKRSRSRFQLKARAKLGRKETTLELEV